MFLVQSVIHELNNDGISALTGATNSFLLARIVKAKQINFTIPYTIPFPFRTEVVTSGSPSTTTLTNVVRASDYSIDDTVTTAFIDLPATTSSIDPGTTLGTFIAGLARKGSASYCNGTRASLDRVPSRSPSFTSNGIYVWPDNVLHFISGCDTQNNLIIRRLSLLMLSLRVLPDKYASFQLFLCAQFFGAADTYVIHMLRNTENSLCRSLSECSIRHLQNGILSISLLCRGEFGLENLERALELFVHTLNSIF